MMDEGISRASEVTGALRYWRPDDIDTITTIGSTGLPKEAPQPQSKHAALSQAYWRKVRGEGPGLFAALFGKKDTSVPETREAIAARARAEGLGAIWTILRPMFHGEEAVPDVLAPEGYGHVLSELGPVAVGLATSAFKHEGFLSQDSFHALGMTFLMRAKLLTALVVSLAGEGELEGERLALAVVSAGSLYETSVREVLKSVAAFPIYDVPVNAAFAKLDEYSRKAANSPYKGLVCRPREIQTDVLSTEYYVPGEVEMR